MAQFDPRSVGAACESQCCQENGDPKDGPDDDQKPYFREELSVGDQGNDSEQDRGQQDDETNGKPNPEHPTALHVQKAIPKAFPSTRRYEQLDELDHRQPDTLGHADVEGESLTAEELGPSSILLAVAGDDTTGTATSLGMHFLGEYPD